MMGGGGGGGGATAGGVGGAGGLLGGVHGLAGPSGLAAHAQCMDARRHELAQRMAAMADEGGGVAARQDALLASQRYVQRSLRTALVACNADEEWRSGVERPLRPPEELMWSEMVTNVGGLTSALRSAIAANH